MDSTLSLVVVPCGPVEGVRGQIGLIRQKYGCWPSFLELIKLLRGYFLRRFVLIMTY